MRLVNIAMAAVHCALSFVVAAGGVAALGQVVACAPSLGAIACAAAVGAGAVSLRASDRATWQLHVASTEASKHAPGAWCDVDATRGFPPPPEGLLPYARTAIAIVFHQVVILAAFAVSAWRDDVVWGGRRYLRNGGRVARVKLL